MEEIYEQFKWLEAEGFKLYQEEDYLAIESLRLRFVLKPKNNTYRVCSICMKVVIDQRVNKSITKLICFDENYHNYEDTSVEDLLFIGSKLDLLPNNKVFYPQSDLYSLTYLDDELEDEIYND